MGLNLICSRQGFIAVALILGIGLSAYGCADTASINPVVQLNSLTVTPGTLQPAFAGETTQYTVDLTSDVTSVRVTAQAAVAGDTVTINDQATTSRTITLGPEGSTTSVSIVVSESSTSSRTYVVLLKRANLAGNNSLASLNVSPGMLTPAFNANTQNYSVDVDFSHTSINITPTLQDSAATMTVDGQATQTGETRTIPLGGPDSSTPIDIAVTAQNGNVKTYRVTVNRGKSGNNFLQNLAISPGSLDPSFNAGTEGYTVNLPSTLPSNVTSMTVTPTLQDATASMTVNEQAATSGQAQTTPLPAPGSNTFINIVVTAENGSRNTYVIVVTRAALGDNHLSALSVRVGTVTQDLTFTPNTTAYTVNVASDVIIVSVTAALENQNASMKINEQETSSGQTRDIDFGSQESSMTITISVTAPNGGVPNTYRITVNRLAPPAPTIAPDLISEDDSCLRGPITNQCFPGTSDEDNITNVTMPRFRIPQPAAGETPSLYVNGNPISETFDPVANTLTPTTALSDGPHRITSTVTNSAGLESPQSPFLDVTIDTTTPVSP